MGDTLGSSLGALLTSLRLADVLLPFAAMLVSLTFHEAAHALVARLCGDSTAKDQGRLSLNPMAHIDPVGTIILPLLGAFSHLPIIGWAKPVPIDLRQMQHPRLGHILVAAAGPLANFILCALATFATVQLLQLLPADPQALGGDAGGQSAPMWDSWLKSFLIALVWVNANLAFFNLLPIPPLDGGAVLTNLLPPKLGRAVHQRLAPLGFMLLIIMISAHGLDWLPRCAKAYVGMLLRAFGK